MKRDKVPVAYGASPLVFDVGCTIGAIVALCSAFC